MNGLPVRDAPPQPNAHGYVSRPRPPNRQFGTLAGLRLRLAEWVDRAGTDRSLPWIGLGIIQDLELVMRLLDLREFAEWLKLHGPAEHQAFAADILADQDTLEALSDALRTAGKGNVTDPVKAVEMLDMEARDSEGEKVRAVLVEMGALAADDEETDVPSLVRALLS